LPERHYLLDVFPVDNTVAIGAAATGAGDRRPHAVAQSVGSVPKQFSPIDGLSGHFNPKLVPTLPEWFAP
jgi:hypothetical protein